MTPRFANVLFSGSCNLRCPACIGRLALAGQALPDNLDLHPLTGQREFMQELIKHQVKEVTLTGTNTDPLLYRHLGRLIRDLKRAVPGVRLNLHSNGVLALRRVAEINACHRVCISLPSFRAQTAHKMTGRARVLDLAAIMNRVEVPLKISVLLSEHNIHEVPEIIARCQALGVRRMVLRHPYPGPRRFDPLPGLEPERTFAGNPVYSLDGVEVTVWDFAATRVECLNLYSDGHIGQEYLLG